MRRCDKGKPCGATCIERRDICRMRLKDDLGLKDVRDVIEAPKLRKLETGADFASILNGSSTETGKIVGVAQAKAEEGLYKLMDPYPAMPPKYTSKEESSKFKREKSEFNSRLSKVKPVDDPEKKITLDEVAKVIKEFTGDQSVTHDMRRAQQGFTYRYDGDDPDPFSKKYFKELQRMAQSVEAFLADPRIQEYKVPVEKYRGIRVNVDILRRMKWLAENESNYSDGALSSWSSRLSTAKQFADKEGFRSDKTEAVILRAINKNGVPLGYMSHAIGLPSNTEGEILTSGKGKMKFLKYSLIETQIRGEKLTYHVFDVEELT